MLRAHTEKLVREAQAAGVSIGTERIQCQLKRCHGVEVARTTIIAWCNHAGFHLNNSPRADLIYDLQNLHIKKWEAIDRLMEIEGCSHEQAVDMVLHYWSGGNLEGRDPRPIWGSSEPDTKPFPFRRSRRRGHE